MNALFLIVLTVAAPPADSSQAVPVVAGSQAEAKLRDRETWVTEIRDAMRRQAVAEDLQQPEAVMRLLSLYQELLQDDQLHAPERNRLRLKLRSRLIRVSGQLSEDLHARKTKVDAVRRRADLENKPEKIKTISHDEAVLAQWDQVLGQVLGQAGGLNQGAGGGQGDVLDHGDDLVELIQRVIAPDSWDVNGGPMSIVYYKGLRVLVITASMEVHEKIGGLADGLRRAGN